MNDQLYLNIDQLMDLFLQEIPGAVYPTDRANDLDPAKRSVSSSELRAYSQMFADLYSNLKDIALNKNVTSITASGITAWEKDLFSTLQDSSQPPTVREQNIVSQFRANVGINLPSIELICAAILDPVGLSFDIMPYGGGAGTAGYGSWVFEYSSLEYDTWLAIIDPIIGSMVGFVPLDCSLNYVAAGITLLQLQEIQETAYTYGVLIYGTADADTLALLDLRLTQKEGAARTHVIFNNATPPATPPDALVEGWFSTYLPWYTV